jgi:3-dehydroquinate synthase
VVDYTLPPGEGSKTMENLEHLLSFLAGHRLGRGDLIVALGGGVTGDLAGFGAAVYQRGMSYVQLPTTLLAAVDSSVGGKTAVNLPEGKNLVGAFWQPKLVLCDCDSFVSLPAAELSAGAAECLKYGMLGDPVLFDRLAREGLNTDWADIVAACVAAKADIVRTDEREAGPRRLLNLGHTFGHAIEQLSGFSLRHGEGVALGLLMITRAAERKGLCEPGLSGRVIEALRALNLPTRCPYDTVSLTKAALGDKKRQGDQIALVLPRALGDCFIHSIAVSELSEWIKLGLEDLP